MQRFDAQISIDNSTLAYGAITGSMEALSRGDKIVNAIIGVLIGAFLLFASWLMSGRDVLICGAAWAAIVGVCVFFGMVNRRMG